MQRVREAVIVFVSLRLFKPNEQEQSGYQALTPILIINCFAVSLTCLLFTDYFCECKTKNNVSRFSVCLMFIYDLRSVKDF